MSLPTKDTERLRLLLHANDVPPLAQTRIINGILAKTAPARATTQWANLIDPPRTIIRTLVNTRPKWRPSRAPTYDAYLTLVRKTLDLITIDANALPSPADAAALRRETNAERAAQGKPLLAPKDGAWFTWIPAHVREATVRAFDNLYASPEEKANPLGRRVQPFMTIPQRAALRGKWEGLLKQLSPHVARDYALLETTLEREQYRAANAARKTIRDRMLALDYAIPVPVHWVQVLDPDARARLNAAEKDARAEPVPLSTGQITATGRPPA